MCRVNLSALFFLFISCSANKFQPELKIIRARNRISQAIIEISPLSNVISGSVDIALENCKEQFKWDRWNCPTSDFLTKRNIQKLDRETAFVQAITIAALIYTVTKNCSRGELLGCGCNIRNFSDDAGDQWHWNGCSDKIDFGEKIADQMIDKNFHNRLDAIGYAELHNSRAGRIAVRNSLRKHCRCHGLSGSCALQTCWLSLDAFPEIASEIRKMYDQSILLRVDNYGNVVGDIKEDSLVYMFDSPNYCKKNIISGWEGTKGRLCSRNRNDETSMSERRSCKNVCRSCGHRVRKRQEIHKKRCNCKFTWCCDVTCEICTETVEIFFCG